MYQTFTIPFNKDKEEEEEEEEGRFGTQRPSQLEL